MKKLYFTLITFLFLAISNAQIVNIPDANFKAKLLQANSNNDIASNGDQYLAIDTNGDGEIQVSEANVIKYLIVRDANISNMEGINSFTNLQVLICNNNQLANLNIALTNLQGLICNNNQLVNLNIASLTNLTSLNCSNNQLANLNIASLTNLTALYCNNNQLASLNIASLTNLQTLHCQNNQLANLNIAGLTNLTSVDCSNNQLTSLDASNLTNLTDLLCSSNQISNLNLSSTTHLIDLYCFNNQLSSLNVNDLTSLRELYCDDNQLINLDISSLTSLTDLRCNNNQLSSLDVSGSIHLEVLYCNNNQLTSLNTSSIINLEGLFCSDNLLTSLFIKTSNSLEILFFENNPNLTYICANEKDFSFIQEKITDYGYTNCELNSYCSFTPGGTFYTIQGHQKIDENNNGCDASDSVYPNLKFKITNGTVSGSLISDTSGNYSIPVEAGTHTISPQLENPAYFTVSPTSATVTFPTTTSPFTQDFCIVPNGVHHDLEIVVIPLTVARPGFDAVYKIKYKNKGNLNENATVNFNYNDAILDYVSSNTIPTTQTSGTLSWNIGTLAPFQSGEITVKLNLNSPTETPAVNVEDILNYTANISGLNTDETADDNTSTLIQLVVNSLDPNDKTCLEGNIINPSMIGKYVHYKIRFENTGTYPAQNIVVKDMIDTTKFDISTLQMTDASHGCVTRITDPNKVEFIFENINLPFDDATNDGYVVFKIKTKSDLTVNSTISNSANIYFDYNFPIVTNTATSTFQTLQNNTFEFDDYFTIYPNPVSKELSIQTKQSTEIYNITIYNLLGQQVQTTTNPTKTIDVSNLETGNYIIKVVSDKGISSSKFIKK